MSRPLHEHIDAARLILARAGLLPEDAAFDAELLARHVLGWDRGQLLTRRHRPAPEAFADAYAALVSRRAAREPVALIIGHREFWGLDFDVTRDVLIPRPETEILVEQALDAVRALPHPRIVDVGTGSGCIAVALAHELPAARVVAVDRSAEALAVAARNLARHGLGGRIELVQGNLLDPIHGPADLIVSNPPYVARRDAATLQPEVIRYEPDAALFADEDGLAVLRRLCETAAGRLAPDGTLIVEFGAGQTAALRSIAEANGWVVRNIPDLAGWSRVAIMTRAPVTPGRT